MVVNKEQHSNKNTTRNQNPIVRDKRKSIIVEHVLDPNTKTNRRELAGPNLIIGPLISRYPQK